jgi:integrase
MGDITVPFCEGFRDYLLDAEQLKHPGKKLSQNSAAGYWSTFRGFLKIAYQEKLLQENVNDYLETIDAVDGRREFLTLEEVRQLAATPCDTPDLKNASLFSCLTGLRISDILALNWSNIVKATDGGWCIRIKTEKTDTEATLPLSQEAYELCGTPGTGLVFKNLKRHYTQKPLQDWLKDAGITKHITFHCFRHTFATLQVNEGTDIYTVSHLLTHANVGTTQIYADIVDKSKRDAVERIRIKDNK